MQKIYLTTFALCSLLVCCIGQNNTLEFDNKEYRDYHLAKFETNFVDHFPNQITTPTYTLLSSENTIRGFVGLLLYEYKIDIDSLVELQKEFESRAIAHYKSDANCLLVINRFDTDETYVYPKLIILPDSVVVNKLCYEGLFPIPKFFNYENEVSNPSRKIADNSQDYEASLPPDFDIYVIEAKAGDYFEKYDLIPNRQMPNGWKNGYSKGVAISKDHQSIAYWSVAF